MNSSSIQYSPFQNFLYSIPIIIVFTISELFLPFDVYTTTNAYFDITEIVQKILPLIALVFILLRVNYLSKYFVLFFSLPFLYFIYLIFESLFLYNTFFKFPHVFLKIANLFMVFGIYIFYKKYHLINLEFIMNLIIIMLFVRIIIDPSIISLHSFVQHERLLHAPSIYMLLLPCMYFFNRYIVEMDYFSLIKFLILFFFIVYFQHRTVYAATSIAFIVNLLLLKRQKLLHLHKFIPTAFFLLFLLFFALALLISFYPEIGDKINENFANISNPTKDTTGTSQWRMEQYKSYWPFVKKHIIEGMRLKGFELPIQFYHPEANIPYFEDGTGHHFHSFYYDKLFWLGIIGLVMYITIMIKPIFETINYKLNIEPSKIGLVSFIFSGLVFGISYNIPDFYWTIFGLGLVFIEKSKEVTIHLNST